MIRAMTGHVTIHGGLQIAKGEVAVGVVEDGFRFGLKVGSR